MVHYLSLCPTDKTSKMILDSTRMLDMLGCCPSIAHHLGPKLLHSMTFSLKGRFPVKHPPSSLPGHAHPGGIRLHSFAFSTIPSPHVRLHGDRGRPIRSFPSSTQALASISPHFLHFPCKPSLHSFSTLWIAAPLSRIEGAMGSVGGGGARSVLTKPFDAEEFRKHAHQMVDFIADYHRDIESFPVRSQVEPGYLQKLLPESAPDKPEALEDILSDVQSKIVPGVTHWQSPNFFGFYPSNGSTAGFLGEMLSGGFNIVGFSWITSPAATELEMIVLDWLGKLLQLPNEFLSSGKGGGVIQGTASEAVLVVMLAARKRAVEKVTKDQGVSEFEALGRLVAYTSDQAHSCVNKASQIAGISLENLRLIPTDASTNFSMSPEVLAKTVAADVAAGLVPFFLCGVVGSTSSAAVDPLSKLGDIAKEYEMWFHVDGAYAGNACICPEYRPHLNGVEKADSFNMNPHKWLLTNFDCSTLWVKNPALLVAALSTNPVFLQNKQSDKNLVVDYKDWQIPLGRRFRSLKLWMVMRMYGSTGLRAYIGNHCDLAKHFEELLRTDSRFEIMVPRTFSLICFRLVPVANDADNGYSLNAKLVEAVNSDGNIFITHTALGGLYTIRFAIGGARTELRHVDAAWEAIQLQASKLLKE